MKHLHSCSNWVPDWVGTEAISSTPADLHFGVSLYTSTDCGNQQSIWHHKEVPENSMHLEQLPSNQILMRCQVALEWRWKTWFPKASIDTMTIAPLRKSLKSLFLSRLGSFRLCLFCSSNPLLNNKQQNWNETHSPSSHIEVKLT